LELLSLMSGVTVVIPSRSDLYLQKTVDDLLNKAEGEVEVIVVLDGYWPSPIIKEDPRVKVVHHGLIHDSFGMRASINLGMSIAQGSYVMKVDEHCMFDNGWDKKLAECEPHDVVVPRRMRLDPDKWENIEDGRRPIDYMYLTCPFMRPGDKTNGLRGAEWKEREVTNEKILYDESLSTQGSCYFMAKSHWDEVIGHLEDEIYGPFTSEAQEVGLKTQLSGGRLMTNKKTWYSHWWKGKAGKSYGFSKEQYRVHQDETEKGRVHTVKYWLTTTDYKHDFKWLMEKFWPVPTWGENWEKMLEKDFINNYYKV